MPAEIVLEFTLTPAMVADSRRDYIRKTSGIPAWLRWGILWIGLILLIGFGASGGNGPARWRTGTWTLALLASAAGILTALWNSRRQAVSPAPDYQVMLRFSSLGLVKRSNVSEGRVEWAAFKSCQEMDRFFYLHYPTRVAELVPKAAFKTPEDLAAFRELTKTHLPPIADAGHPVLGKTRPVFYILFVLVIGAVLCTGWIVRNSHTATVSIKEYEENYADVQEVWISADGGMEARLAHGVTREGRPYRRVRIDIPKASLGNPRLIDRLTEGLPHSAIHDARAR